MKVELNRPEVGRLQGAREADGKSRKKKASESQEIQKHFCVESTFRIRVENVQAVFQKISPKYSCKAVGSEIEVKISAYRSKISGEKIKIEKLCREIDRKSKAERIILQWLLQNRSLNV